MRYQEFYYWCRDAVSKIKYTPDRNKVYTELYTHLEDRYESFLAKGLREKDAEQKALETMGDPHELAPQLAAIHKPHWAYAMVVTRFLVCVLLILTLSHGIVFFFERDIKWDNGTGWQFNVIGEAIVSIKPDVSDHSDGYIFRVTDAAVYRTELPEEVNGKAYYDQIFVRLAVSNPLPWAPEQNALEHMWAVDSHGRRHGGIFQPSTPPDVSHISVIRRSEKLLNTYYYELCFHNTSEDTQWVELHYDRDGRDLVLRVDLSGGGANVEGA